ncbi:MAG: acyl-CoA dehydrogenase family protein [Pseudomonadota bacterium]
MQPRQPISELATHQVTNMPPYMGDQNLWQDDRALRDWVSLFGGGWAREKLERAGAAAGAALTFEKADAANRFPPELRAFDRYGMRINQVEFHPAYHELMELAVRHEVPNFAWNHKGPGAQVAHMALTYMFSQPEGGVMCPMAMTYAIVPVLNANKDAAEAWVPKLLSTSYDGRDIPVDEKAGATVGMFMTEKQGGSDVRTNSTRAVPSGKEEGTNSVYLLSGHKFFCSAPMSDAFLTLAYTDVGLSCFLVPRWRPDGERNNLAIQRLKNKLGNRSNASSEMEFEETWSMMIGEEGRGIPTIIEMVKGTRIYCAASSAAMMRQGLVQALHHASHRSAFQKRLIQQPLMRNVLADLAIEVEAAIALVMRVASALDQSEENEDEAVFARIGTAIAKYWICKRAPAHLFEAMECHGGAGYIEESILPRLYREAPVNSIWEGSGNVICLDVLRALHREPTAISVILKELEGAKGRNDLFDQALDGLKDELSKPEDLELRARNLTERLALVIQAGLLLKHGLAATAEAFCVTRLGARWTGCYGVLPATVDIDTIIDRALPAGL